MYAVAAVVAVIAVILVAAFASAFSVGKTRDLPSTVTGLPGVSASECGELIRMAEKKPYLTTLDPVDMKPVYEMHLIDNDKGVVRIQLPDMWAIADRWRSKFQPKLPKEIRDKKPSSCFFRRYCPEERQGIPIHHDNCAYAVVVQVSDPGATTGGEFYIFPKDSTVGRLLISAPNKLQAAALRDMGMSKELPMVKLAQGDSIVYSGRNHSHGVLPVTQGVRHSLIYFYGGEEDPF